MSFSKKVMQSITLNYSTWPHYLDKLLNELPIIANKTNLNTGKLIFAI
jgi:hypothetical protein